MISMSELLKGKKEEDLPQETRDNLQKLLVVINKVRALYGQPMIVTSCVRTMEEHLAIYAKKGITDKSKIPMKSKHLYGLAVDISDPDRKLKEWCLQNEAALREIGVWMEAFESTPNWVHFQCVQYGSYQTGKSLWFKP
jgi:uncharacterized protein YcbK (DUF882 family)